MTGRIRVRGVGQMPEEHGVTAGTQPDRHVAGSGGERRAHERRDRGGESPDEGERADRGERGARPLDAEGAERHGDAVHELGEELGHPFSLRASRRPIAMAARAFGAPTRRCASVRFPVVLHVRPGPDLVAQP